jgi:hypothetical protein
LDHPGIDGYTVDCRIQHVQSNVVENPEIEALIDWQNKDDIMAWLDDL